MNKIYTGKMMSKSKLLLLLALFSTYSIAEAKSEKSSRYGMVREKKQQIIITGTVKDKDNQVLPGVSVRLKGSAIATVTDINGKYKIAVTDQNSILIFSYIGFRVTEEIIGQRSQINVNLQTDQQTLNEVAVVGYGTVTRKDLTGAVAKADITEMVKAPVASFEDALAGRVAGVQVSSNQGQPGSANEIVIRGANSVTQSNSPLYVIDGFPIEDPSNAAINPQDIASIDVLKDASATAIYGSRGANGVIVIETKKGLNGKSVISYNGSLGFQEVTKKMDMMNAYDFVKLQQEIDPVLTAQQYFVNRDLESYRDATSYNWQDQIFRRAPLQMHNISIVGGNSQTKYTISGSIYDQKGVIINSGFKRYQGRFSIDQVVSPKLKVGLNTNYSVLQNFGQIASDPGSSGSASSYLLYSVWGFRPVTGNDTDLTGDLLDPDISVTNDFRVNPVISTSNELRQDKTRNLTANGYLNYAIIKDLSLKITGGISNRMIRGDAFYNSQTSKGTPLIPTNTRGSYGIVAFEETNNWVNENTLTYKKKLGNHSFDVLGGFTMQGRSLDSYGLTSTNVPNESLGLSGLDEGTPFANVALESENTLVSAIGRINYNYKSKYLLTGSYRADGSSKFAANNRWGYFPSGAFAWRMSSEGFMKPLTFISDAKFRVSYGLTGNNRVNDYATYASLSFLPVNPNLTLTNNYSFNNATPGKGVIPSTLPNQDLKWETTSQLDLGYDLSLFKNRISIVADVYKKVTTNLLLNANVPYTTGYIKALKNIGKTENRGLELSLTSVNIQSPSFTWSTNFNISFNRNKLLALAENEKTLLSTINWEIAYATTPLYLAEVGSPVAQFYGFKWDGVYQYPDFDLNNGVYALKSDQPYYGANRNTIQPGDIKYSDINGDGKVDDNDRTVIGNPLPKNTGGFSNNFAYKGFDLGVLLQWSYGNDVMNANRIIFEGNALNYRNLNQYASYTDRWTPENQSNTLARVGGQGPRGVYSSRIIEDGSYLRLKTVSFGYAIPQKFLSKLKVAKVYFSASAQNLLTITGYSGMDPEVSVRNSALTPSFDYSAYPRAKTLTFDLKISL
jgi:TonB-linked SusC/RagA family outer membrane protein